MQQMVCAVRFREASADMVEVGPIPTRPAESQLKHSTRTTYIVTSWWWATSKPETCRGIVTEYTDDKPCIRLVSLHAYSRASVHERPCSRKIRFTNKFSEQKSLGWRTVSRITNTQAGKSGKLRASARECQLLVNFGSVHIPAWFRFTNGLQERIKFVNRDPTVYQDAARSAEHQTWTVSWEISVNVCRKFEVLMQLCTPVGYPGIFSGGGGYARNFFGGGGFNKFSWGQRAERTGIWGR
jgi:hypothetical protein